MILRIFDLPYETLRDSVESQNQLQIRLENPAVFRFCCPVEKNSTNITNTYGDE
jgi:hypothetical protein